jgi:tetratricopeptide (TPR) repeat protein
VRRVADGALAVLERAGDHHGRGRVWSLRAQAAWTVGRVAEADAAWREAGECARQAGEERGLFESMGWRATASVFGPTPVDEAIGYCEEFRGRVAASPIAVLWMVNPLASLHAMRGDFDLAERYLNEANETLRSLGNLGTSVSHHEALVWLLAGRHALAEIPLRAGLENLASMGDGRLRATTTAMLAQAVYAQGHLEEAGELCDATAAGAAADDIVTQVIWRSVKAKILAGDGRAEEAESLARDAVGLVEPTDLLLHRADAMLDLAAVMWMGSRAEESSGAARAGLSLYERKGNAVGAARARSLLANQSEGSR